MTHDFGPRAIRAPRVSHSTLFALAARLAAVGLASFIASFVCACSPPGLSDTDEREAPTAPISARPNEGIEAGSITDAAASRFRGAIGLVEIADAKGKRVATCTATALARDLALTSSRCASDCARTRVRFSAAASGKGSGALARCSAVEVLESTAGKGFALLRLVAGGAGETLPTTKITLDEKATAKGEADVYLVAAVEEGQGVGVALSERCVLRYSAEKEGEATHACALAPLAQGGLLVDSSSLAARGIYDRTETGARLVTTSAQILAR